MKKLFKRAASATIAGIMLMMNAPKISIVNAVSPTIPKNVFALKVDLDTTWATNWAGTLANPGGTNQYVLFGRYPQTEITDITGLTENVDYAVLNQKYFRIESIKWRILANSDGKLFLMSDSCIDADKPFQYNGGRNESPDSTWANSDLRKWLNSEVNTNATGYSEANAIASGTNIGAQLDGKYSNGFWGLISGKFGANGFLQSAFTSNEQNKISAETIPFSHATSNDWANFVWGETQTLSNQKIFILSGDYSSNSPSTDCEMRNMNYGFSFDSNTNPARRLKITDYAKENGGAHSSEGYGYASVRSSYQQTSVSFIYAWCTDAQGDVVFNATFDTTMSSAPAFKMDLSSVRFASAANSAPTNGFETISTTPAMTLRFNSSGTNLANTQVTKTGNKTYYTNAPTGSKLVVVATDSNDTSYQYIEPLPNGGEGTVDLSSKTNFTDGMTYKAWIESENGGLLYATPPAQELVPNLVSITLPQLVQKSNGTALENFGLPTQVGIVTSRDNVNETGSAYVTWNTDSGLKTLDGSSYTYNPDTKTQQIFTVDGSVSLPVNVTNTSNISTDIKIYVVVLAAGISIPSDETVFVSVVAPDPIIKEHGTAADATALGLPFAVNINTVSLTSSLNAATQSVTRTATTSEVSCAVNWDLSDISSLYDPNKEEQQILTVNGTITLPEGVSNPSELELKANSTVVVLAKAYTPPPSLEFLNISIPELITKPNGTPKTIVDLGLPTTVNIESGPAAASSTTTAAATWNLSDVVYEASLKTQQVLEINGAVTLPESIRKSTGIATMKIKMYVVILAASENSPSTTNQSSSNTSSGTSSTSPNSGSVFPNSVKQTQESSDSSDVFEQWVQVNFGGNQNHKFGIRAPKGVIEPGSTFYAEMIGPENEKYSDYANALDKDVSVENVQFLNLEVIKPDGTTKYTELSSPVKIFAQWPENWDRDDQLMLKLMPGSDIERKFIEFNDIDGVSYASYEFPGFSPYALIDKLTGKEAKELWWDQNKYWIISLYVVLALAIVGIVIYLAFRYYKKRSRKM